MRPKRFLRTGCPVTVSPEPSDANSLRFSKKERLASLLATALAHSSLRANNPWVLIPTLTVSCGAFVYILVRTHGGSRLRREW